MVEGGADGVEVVGGGGEGGVAVGEAVGFFGVGEPDEAVGGAVGAEGGDGEGWVVGVVYEEAQAGGALFGEVHGEAVGGAAGEVKHGGFGVGDGAPGGASVDEGGDLDAGGALEVAVGGFQDEAGDGGVVGLEGDFGGAGFAVLGDLLVGGGPFLRDGLVFFAVGGFVPELDGVHAEGGAEEVVGALLVLALGLDEVDEGLGAFFGGVADGDGEVAAVVFGEGDVGVADVHVAGVVEDFGFGEGAPEFAVVAAGDEDGADEVFERGLDGDAVGGGGFFVQLKAGFDAVVGEFLEGAGLGGGGVALGLGLGGAEGFDEAGEFAVGGVEEAQVGVVGLDLREDGGVEMFVK